MYELLMDNGGSYDRKPNGDYWTADDLGDAWYRWYVTLPNGTALWDGWLNPDEWNGGRDDYECIAYKLGFRSSTELAADVAMASNEYGVNAPVNEDDEDECMEFLMRCVYVTRGEVIREL